MSELRRIVTPTSLSAGVASLPILPPLGVDMVGYLRRWAPATGYGEPLEAGVLVLDDGGGRRLAIAAFDGLGAPGDYGHRLRAAVASAAGCALEAVLVNGSHTHAAPPPPNMLKIGGTTPHLRVEEERYAESLLDLVASAAELAASRLEPVRLGAARTTVELGVNRRQRTPEGTVVGWNPDGVCDRDVAVLRLDDADGHAIATVVAYACHPTVVGPEAPEFSSDFVGPLRARIREWTGGDCLFLQGCAGNILPLEAHHERSGPERDFADRLALAALHARDLAETVPREPRQKPLQSAVPIAVWRLEPTGELPEIRLDSRDMPISLPFLTPPKLAEITKIREDLEQRVAKLQQAGAGRETWNPLDIHASWAGNIEGRIKSGSLEGERATAVQVLRVGDVGIAALPCEPFCELGLEIKRRSAAPFPIVLGYSNDLVGYVATADEYQYGGYEPAISQRHYGNPSPFAPEVAQLLVDHAVALLRELFDPATTLEFAGSEGGG